MQFIDRINAIEDRGQAINLTLHRLCDMAGVEYSTVHRWRMGEANPKVKTIDEHLGALEDELNKHETKARKALARSAGKTSRTA